MMDDLANLRAAIMCEALTICAACSSLHDGDEVRAMTAERTVRVTAPTARSVRYFSTKSAPFSILLQHKVHHD